MTIAEHLSPDEWHECYHYMGSRVLEMARFLQIEVLKTTLSAARRTLMLDRLLNELVCEAHTFVPA